MDDCLKRQTASVTPAKPGGFPWVAKYASLNTAQLSNNNCDIAPRLCIRRNHCERAAPIVNEFFENDEKNYSIFL